MKRESLRRTLSGTRAATLHEALMILEATGNAGEKTLPLLMMVVQDFALAKAGTPSAGFLGELLRRAPCEIVEQFGENIDELRPRWANETAKLLARKLAQHVTDINRRGDAIGERHSITIGT